MTLGGMRVCKKGQGSILGKLRSWYIFKKSWEIPFREVKAWNKTEKVMAVLKNCHNIRLYFSVIESSNTEEWHQFGGFVFVFVHSTSSTATQGLMHAWQALYKLLCQPLLFYFVAASLSCSGWPQTSCLSLPSSWGYIVCVFKGI